MTLLEAREILGIDETVGLDDARRAWREKVRATHPDRGGDVAAFIRVQAAWEIVAGTYGAGTDAEFGDIPLPPELRAVIDEIVAGFRAQYEGVRERCARELEAFRVATRSLIAVLERKELGRFGVHFTRRWNDFVAGLFAGYNRSAAELTKKYENWFSCKTEPLREDAFARELARYRELRRQTRFWIPALAGGGAGIWIAAAAGKTVATVVGAGMLGAGLAGLVALGWFTLCRRPVKVPPERPVFDVAPFSLEQALRFQAGETVRTGQNARWAGGLLGAGLFGNSALGGVGAGLAGFAVIAVLDHLVNPTRRIREALSAETDAFVATVLPEMTAWLLEQHQQVLDTVAERILARYREGTWRTVRLLTREAGHE